MKTTLEISGPLLERAKRVATEEAITLRSMVEAGLRRVLRERDRAEDFSLRRASVGGRGLAAGLGAMPWEQVIDRSTKGGLP